MNERGESTHVLGLVWFRHTSISSFGTSRLPSKATGNSEEIGTRSLPKSSGNRLGSNYPERLRDLPIAPLCNPWYGSKNCVSLQPLTKYEQNQTIIKPKTSLIPINMEPICPGSSCCNFLEQPSLHPRTYCGWTKSISHHLRNPGMMIPL